MLGALLQKAETQCLIFYFSLIYAYRLGTKLLKGNLHLKLI